jgi:cytoskeletal protein CcmA (bactofilin family)
MANRFPLIVNTTSGNSVQELPAGDFLDLSNSGISNSGNITVSGIVSATGNIVAGGNLIISGAIQDSAQLDIQTTAGNANIVLTPNGTGNVNISANIMPTANATANIGSATSSFNTVFAKATSAQYADLAEKYLADTVYAPGTVVEFGGNNEVTVSTVTHSTAVAGIVSTDPAYLMNSQLQGVYTVSVALIGRVPCRVQGPVKKGSVLVTGTVPGTAMAIDNLKFEPGCVVGKAMETIDSVDVKTIEVAVGRL